MSGAHARYSPSAAAKWMTCLGALHLEQGQPDTSSVYADEGTAAHHVASVCLQTHKHAADFLGRKVGVSATGCGWADGADPIELSESEVRTFIVDDAMASAIQVYLDYIRDVKGDEGLLLVEQKLDLANVYQMPGQFGTGDAIVVNFAKRNMLFGDLKFGRGEQVYAKENHQLMIYALGALDLLEVTGIEVDMVTLAIIQPRLDWIDEWTVSVEELKAFRLQARNSITLSVGLTVEKIITPDAKGEFLYLTPSEKACRWCKAKALCPALAARVSAELTNDFTAVDTGRAAAMVSAGQSIATDEQISKRMAVLDMVKDWAAAVNAEGTRRVFAGATILGSDGVPMKIVEGKQGDRAWSDKDKALEALVGVLTPDQLYPKPELLGVPKIEEAMGKPKFRAMFVGTPATDTRPAVPPLKPGHIFRAPGKPTIALGTDKRPPMSAPPATAGEFDAVVVDPLCM